MSHIIVVQSVATVSSFVCTIISVFLIILITVSSFQMCTKDSYDVYIMYAGSRDVRGIKNEGDVSEYNKVYRSFAEVVPDFDENGEICPSLETLFMLSEDEIKQLEKELADKKENGEGSYEINYSVLAENNNTFRDRLMYSEFYVCILSRDLYLANKTISGVSMFTPLSPYVKEGTEVEYLDECAIYIDSLDFGALPGISDFPEGTVIALRSMSAISSHFDKDGNEENYRRSEKVVENIINYVK